MRSERKMLPIGVENFEKLRRNNMYYVDKQRSLQTCSGIMEMQICLPVPVDSAKR